MRHARIITLYKIKGERSDGNNFHGIFLRVLIVSIQNPSIDLRRSDPRISSPGQLQEKRPEQEIPIYIDLSKVFSLVSRNSLVQLQIKIRCSSLLLSINNIFHDKMPLKVQSIAKQWCVLASTFLASTFIYYRTSRSDNPLKCILVPNKQWQAVQLEPVWEQRPKYAQF